MKTMNAGNDSDGSCVQGEDDGMVSSGGASAVSMTKGFPERVAGSRRLDMSGIAGYVELWLIGRKYKDRRNMS